MSLRCWLFGHEQGPWFDGKEYAPADMDMSEFWAVRVSKCRRCQEVDIVTFRDPMFADGGESDG